MTGFVYFIAEWPLTDGLVKVGWAQDPKARLRSLQCGNPRQLALLALVAAHREDEERAHAALRDHRRRGEWFELPYPGMLWARGRGGLLIVPLDDLIHTALHGDLGSAPIPQVP